MLASKIAREVRSPFSGIELNDPSLVFYAPLWHPDSTISPFLSKDLNRISCTNNGATWTLQSNGLYVPYFDGTDDVISCGNPASCQIQTPTVEAWIKWIDKAASHPNFIIAYGSGGYAFYIYETGAGNALKLCFGKNGTNEVVSSLTITDTNWHHVAVSYDGTNAVFYKDLVPDSQAYAAPGFTFTTNLGIGGLATGASYFKGTIGAVRINGQPLSLAQLTQSNYTTKWRFQ